jgi:uncharacterized oxidoreductase
MKLNGNTIFITGGGSGIGRGLAEALHRRGNKVIISGRRRGHLDTVLAANPGMEAVELDVTDPASIAQVAVWLEQNHPALNVLINNAGVMIPDDAAGVVDEAVMANEIATNLTGPIRLTGALLGQLKRQKEAWVVYNSSILAFTPLAPFAVYSATKAAIHSYALSQRYLLRGTNVKVQEIAPPWVATELLGEPDARAMNLDDFIAETMQALGTDAEEVLVEQARVNRNNPGPGEHRFVGELNDFFVELMAAAA